MLLQKTGRSELLDHSQDLIKMFAGQVNALETYEEIGSLAEQPWLMQSFPCWCSDSLRTSCWLIGVPFGHPLLLDEMNAPARCGGSRLQSPPSCNCLRWRILSSWQVLESPWRHPWAHLWRTVYTGLIEVGRPWRLYWMKRRKQAQHQCLEPVASCWWMHDNQMPQLPPAVPFLPRLHYILLNYKLK